ncbi:malate dehydrogenase-like isoform X2 [Anthonomus grandis grandis]|uniref:malate dehydrogenase-like isoform X2 n=1 Tax=Anthonomus grandis grandis TaxID=2921223 RepID=UPI002166A01C|nr:malate dehydrogenase-like isoform X2 [Anthonomus grandis grandis]
MSSRRLLSSLGATLLAKRFSSCQCPCANKYKVAVIGACGGIGQPLSLLMKLNPNVSELRLHDMEEWTGGVAADLSHIETAAKVSWTCGNNMSDALCGGVDIILVPAGMPRKPGMKRSDLFKSNAEVAFYAAEAMAKVSPGSILILVTNPVNALLPICCEVLKHYGKLCPQRVIGASTLDSVRAATFVAELTCADPKDITIPVVGGHSGSTILPLLSRANPAVCFDEKTADDVIKKIQQAGTTVLNAKKGHGTATLAMAYAASRLAFAIIRALNGEPNINAAMC